MFTMSYIIEFGKHKGKTIEEMMQIDQGYILWLAGVHMRASFHVKSKDAYQFVQTTYPQAIEAAKNFMKDKCQRCLLISDTLPHCMKCQHLIDGR